MMSLTKCRKCEELATCTVTKPMEDPDDNLHRIALCDDCADNAMEDGWNWGGLFKQPYITPRPFRPGPFDQA